jgi:hypothetical protein
MPIKTADTMASTAASTNPPAPGSDSSSGGQKRDPFSHLLTFPDEMVPVYEELADEQDERRRLDAVRIQKNIMYIDRINVALDVDVKERIVSDQLIEQLAISRLDNMQRKLVTQVLLPHPPTLPGSIILCAQMCQVTCPHFCWSDQGQCALRSPTD